MIKLTRKIQAAKLAAQRQRKSKKTKNPIHAIIERHRPNKLIYPNEAPLQATTQFPPKKRHVNLSEFLKTNGERPNSLFRHNPWFEDANYLFRPDFDDNGTYLTFAQSKEMYFIQRHSGFNFFFDMEDACFDSRFILPDLPKGNLYLGNYQHDQFGRTFFLTEPKDATDMLISITEHTNDYEWLKNNPNVKYFRHKSERSHLHFILSFGSQIDTNHKLVIIYSAKKQRGYELLTKLFTEKLRHAINVNFQETRYVRPLTEAEKVSRDHRADYTERLKVLSEKFNQICQFRHLSAIDPFEDPVSVRYQDSCYFYNDADMYNLEATVNADYEFYQKLAKCIESAENLIKNALGDTLTEFDVELTLRLDRRYYLVSDSKEIVSLTVFKNSYHTPIYQRSISINEFDILPEDDIAKSLAEELKSFFDNHREKFYVLKRLYDVNVAYRNLVDPSACKPELDYSYIFRDF